MLAMWSRVARSGDGETSGSGKELACSFASVWWSVVWQLFGFGDQAGCSRVRFHRLIVTVSGPHGSGKSTYAERLAGSLGLRHVSAGLMFRKLAEERQVLLEKFQELAAADPSIDRLVDERTMIEAERGDVVVDGQLAGWVLKEISDLRVLLTAPLVVRLERIAARDRVSLEEARRQTLHREGVQAERYRKHYGFSVDDWSIYQLVLDTSFGSIEDTAKILLAAALTAKNAKMGKSPEKNPGPQPIPAGTNPS